MYKRLALVSRRWILFHHGKSRSQVDLRTRQKILDLSWEVLYHSNLQVLQIIFMFFDHYTMFFPGRTYNNVLTVKTSTEQYFDFKTQGFYRINLMPDR